ncbi:MAG: response regulator transcription factor [Dehalococcoidia bacterium]|nr:response regulator transcription factor [Dehalococcoidia bacterium]
MKVLVIEDDVATVEAIRLCLEIHRPDTSATLTAKGIEGIELLRGEAPDVVILDLGLPDIDGIRVLEQIRQFSNVPVLIVSARDTQDSIVKGLELGAEDYIVKPFDYRDLLERLDNVIRLSQMPRPRAGEVRIKGGGLEIDLGARRVTVAGNPVELTPVEWSLLTHLVENEGGMVPLQRLAREVWKDNSIDSSTMKSTVSRLRTKLGDDPHAPRIILSEHGVGYRFVRPE